MKTERRIRRSGKERSFEGVGVSSGIALGTAHLVETGAVHIPEYEISASQVEEEQARFAKAVATAQKQIRKLGAKAAGLHGAAAEEIAILLEAHLQMLSGSRVLRGVEHRIARDRSNAEAAVQAEISDVAQEFAALDDPYIAARADDVREVGDRLIRNLTKTPFAAFSHLPEGTIIVAEDLTPADTALMDPAMIAGFTTLLGGAESHTAIMARSLGLPAVLGVAGLLGAIKSGDSLIIDGDEGRVIVRPSAATDLLTLSAGMILGFLIGAIQFPAFGATVGLGNAGGLLVAGVIVSSIASRLRFFGNTPAAARNVLEDLGLVVFVAIVGINAGNSLLSQLTGVLALKIFLIGFVACSIPPVIVWMIGLYVFKFNAAILMGGVAGARSHSGPCREAAVEIQSNVPWIGFPVAYAVSGVLLTIFGYFAMVLAQ